MRQASLLASTAFGIVAAAFTGWAGTAGASNTMEGTVVSTEGGTLVVRMESGESSSFMPDGVSLPLDILSVGDPVMIQMHPTDNGTQPRVTVTRGTRSESSDRDQEMQTELVGTGMIRLSNVQFDTDKATIRPDAYPALDAVGRALSRWPGLRIRIDAYTDSQGEEDYNLELSHRRADSVRSYLLKHYPQLEESQLTAEGHGEADPLVPNTTPENMAMNRRVEFVVLNKEMLQPR